MNRIWKPLDVGGKRLYKVTLQYYTKDKGLRVYGNHEDPLLVFADSPRDAAAVVGKIYNSHESRIRVECYGHAVNVLMPESWWIEGIPEAVALLALQSERK